MYYIKNSMLDKYLSYINYIMPNYDGCKLLEKVGFSIDDISNDESYLDYAKFAKLLYHSANVLQQPLFALKYAQYINETNKSMLDKVLPLLKSLDMAYHFSQEYMRSHTNAISVKRKFMDGHVFLYWYIFFEVNDEDAFQANLFFAYRTHQQIHKIIRENFSNGNDVIIHLPKKYEALIDELHLALTDDLNCDCSNVIFDEFGYSVSYPASYNDVVFKVKCEEMFDLIESTALVNSARPSRVFSDDVAILIKKNIDNGERNDLLSISQSFFMHPRTLQFKLSHENKKFADILSQVRKDAVINLLSDKDIPIYIIAEKLGFSDSAIFSRAFKNWFNLSPSEWRKMHSK